MYMGDALSVPNKGANKAHYGKCGSGVRMAYRRILSKDPRKNCGTNFGSSSLFDSKVAKGKVDPSLDLVSLCVLTETLYCKLPLISFPTY